LCRLYGQEKHKVNNKHNSKEMSLQIIWPLFFFKSNVRHMFQQAVYICHFFFKTELH
jgi:hypothetical protein